MNLSANNFEKQSKETWLTATEKFLKGKPYDSLVRQLNEQITLEPYYTKEETAQLVHLQSIHNDKLALNEPVNVPRFWYNQPVVAVKSLHQLEEANKEIRKLLMSGAEGVLIDLSNLEEDFTTESWNTLLFEVVLPYCAISFKTQKVTASFVQHYFDYATSQNVTIDQLTGGIIQQESAIQTEDLKELTSLMQGQIIRFSPFSICVNSLADEAQSLAETLLQIKNYVEIAGENSLYSIQFVVYVNDDFFMTACKLRALRWLIQQVFGLYGIEKTPLIHCLTTLGTDEKSIADEHWNLIRNTTQALSCVLGGTDSLTVVAHQQEVSTNWTTRIARNVSTMLCEESFMDKVADPLAGSYYAEQLTEKLIASAWSKFQEQI